MNSCKTNSWHIFETIKFPNNFREISYIEDVESTVHNKSK